MKIIITTSSFAREDDSSVKLLKAAGYELIFNPYGRTLSELEIMDLIRKHRPTGVIAGLEPWTEQVMEAAKPLLQVISRCGAGLDNVDLVAAQKLNIHVTNTPEAPAEAVAELTLAFVLSLIRNVTTHDQSVRAGLWQKRMGFLVNELTIGLIGLGRVGKRVGTLLSPFGCKIVGSDIMPDIDWLAKHHIDLLSVDEVLLHSDVVSIHLPDAKGDLHHFFNHERLKMMKKGAFLINTSRGSLIEEVALIESLENNHLAGVALDVFEEEPYSGNLLKTRNVILSPHTGSYARATRNRMEIESVRNLLVAADG